ncbi:MAG TPA: helix-turn-helix domain-containing protein [Thermoanaerobaculia bacterium]|nr:helix-turn-helix domain-containing protein [Thermoanaerobaculia bacterium]
MKKAKADPWVAECPSRELIDFLAGKWVLLLVPVLRNGPHRNAELLRKVGGISQRMLTQTLRGLEERRLLVRRDYHEIPPRVEYQLTPLGRSLADAISVLDEWVIRNYDRTVS